jgi:hypothetical protein
MPPKKRTTTRPAQRQPQQVVSDYDETDTAAFTDNAAANIAPPPSRTNTELNLLVLRRYCPDVERIVQIAPFAVVYSFSPDTQGWEKIGTEGTLFVCQLAGASYSRYSVIILNRKSLDNFIVELVSAENVEITDSYVILQSPGEDGVDQIYGLWIFSEDDVQPSTQEVVAMAIEECALRAEEGKKLAEEAYGAGDSNDLEGVLGGGRAEAAYSVELTVESTQPAQIIPPPGQQIDLMQLFGKPQVPQPSAAPEQHQQQFYSNRTSNLGFLQTRTRISSAVRTRPPFRHQRNSRHLSSLLLSRICCWTCSTVRDAVERATVAVRELGCDCCV